MEIDPMNFLNVTKPNAPKNERCCFTCAMKFPIIPSRRVTSSLMFTILAGTVEICMNIYILYAWTH